ncbi:DNA-binding protein [Marinobacter salicampi]|uniref:DNA-binding protein n=1 Tax=Marinobacter salicampi TaxID=435907 RepID=UPI00140A5870|nr:DNA-binding protein [Marinobacter salicampi]
MARTGVTFEQVVEAVKAIEAEDETPTIQRIRQRLGTGSPNTIHRHLRSFQEQSRPQKPVALKLPEKLQDALLAEIARQASEARAESESEAKEAMATADELAEIGERMEVEITALNERIVALEKSQIESDVKLSAKDEEIERLRHELNEERTESEKIRMTIREDEHRYQVVCDQVANLKGQLADSLSELSTVRSELREAEHTATYSEAQRGAQKERILASEDRIAELREEMTQLRQELKTALKAKDELAEESTKLKIELASVKKPAQAKQRSRTSTTKKQGESPKK